MSPDPTPVLYHFEFNFLILMIFYMQGELVDFRIIWWCIFHETPKLPKIFPRYRKKPDLWDRGSITYPVSLTQAQVNWFLWMDLKNVWICSLINWQNVWPRHDQVSELLASHTYDTDCSIFTRECYCITRMCAVLCCAVVKTWNSHHRRWYKRQTARKLKSKTSFCRLKFSLVL